MGIRSRASFGAELSMFPKTSAHSVATNGASVRRKSALTESQLNVVCNRVHRTAQRIVHSFSKGPSS